MHSVRSHAGKECLERKGAARLKMKDQLGLHDEFLNQTMEALGYQRVRKLIYKATWSSPEVEHFLYLETYGRPKEFLTARFGIRNSRAELFSLNSIKAYGGEIYQLIRHDDRYDCMMNFSFERLNTPIRRWALYMPDYSMPMLMKQLTSEIEERLLPVVRDLDNLHRLFSFLLSDAEPCPWVASNGAARAAQVVSIGHRISIEAREILAGLQPREKWITLSLNQSTYDAVSYINRLLKDCR